MSNDYPKNLVATKPRARRALRLLSAERSASTRLGVGHKRARNGRNLHTFRDVAAQSRSKSGTLLVETLRSKVWAVGPWSARSPFG